MIAIIDYGAGNVSSVKNALDFLNVKSIITSEKHEIEAADKLILPGVGSFGPTIRGMRKNKLDEVIKNQIVNGKPYLGICIGFQILFDSSEEDPNEKGLGILKGKVVKFKNGKVPQIGWNKIIPKNNFFTEDYFYFVNSYYVIPNNNELIAATTDYHVNFASAIKKDNITAVQFHLEKSGKAGLKLLERWLNDN